MCKHAQTQRILAALLCAAACFAMPAAHAQPEVRAEVEVPFRAITSGPQAHWFGYYDKLQFDPSGRYVLGMEVMFQNRTPTPDDTIKLGMVDLNDGDRWIELGESRSWGWQQGCMLQWIPGSEDEVIYNDRRDGKFVSVIKNVTSGDERVLPKPVYALSPDGRHAVGANFARIQFTRPGYGYHGVDDPTIHESAPEGDGIYTLDLQTGETKTIISIAQIAAIPQESTGDGPHWFNHLLFNTDGSRFIFLHRVHLLETRTGGWRTRMFTANADGSDLRCVADHGMVSHFIWKNPQEILAWSREPEPGNRYHVYNDATGDIDVIGEGVLTVDGHCTYSPDGEWILTDTYPNKERMITLMLYRPSDGKLVTLGKFFHPKDHRGEYRCDLHPGWSRDGRYVCIDSLHENDTRQMYVLDVSGIIGQ